MMKRTLVTIVTAATLLVGCSSISEAGTPKRFVTLSYESLGRVVYDTQTGVEYWVSDGPHSDGTLTVLVDADGKPLIYKEEAEL